MLDWKKRAEMSNKGRLREGHHVVRKPDTHQSSCNYIDDDEEDCEIAEEEQIEKSYTSHLSSSRLTSSEIEKDQYAVQLKQIRQSDISSSEKHYQFHSAVKNK